MAVESQIMADWMRWFIIGIAIGTWCGFGFGQAAARILQLFYHRWIIQGMFLGGVWTTIKVVLLALSLGTPLHLRELLKSFVYGFTHRKLYREEYVKEIERLEKELLEKENNES